MKAKKDRSEQESGRIFASCWKWSCKITGDLDLHPVKKTVYETADIVMHNVINLF